MLQISFSYFNLFISTDTLGQPTNFTWPNLSQASLFSSGPWTLTHHGGALEQCNRLPLAEPPENQLTSRKNIPWSASYLCSWLTALLNTRFFLAFFTPPLWKKKAICSTTFETLTDVMMGAFSRWQLIVPLPLSQMSLSPVVIILLNNIFPYLRLDFFFNLTLQLLKPKYLFGTICERKISW